MEVVKNTPEVMNKITFKNKCSVPAWMPEEKKVFRENSDEYFKKALAQVPMFEGQDLELEYFLNGVGSIVAKIVTSSGEIFVMKTTEIVNRTNAEVGSYKAMIEQGIKVPKLFYDGDVDGHPFFIMEYFGQGTLGDKLESGEISFEEVGDIKAKFFVDLKKIPGKGFNWPTKYENGVLVGNISNIDDFMSEWFGKPELVGVAETHLPGFPWEENLKRHTNRIKENQQGGSTKLGTFDFQNGHLFASDPATLFDPATRLEPEYLDLGHLLIPDSTINEDYFKIKKIILSKYQETFGVINVERLSSAIWLQAYRLATNFLLRTDERRTRVGLYLLNMIKDENVLREYVDKCLGK